MLGVDVARMTHDEQIVAKSRAAYQAVRNADQVFRVP